MIQLVYLSFAKDGLSEEDLEGILNQSRQNNPSKEITGILMQRGGIFLQLLEGPEENVNALYEKIGKDNRHKDILKLGTNETNTRLFSDWSMAYASLKDLDLEVINTVLPWSKLVDRKRESLPVYKVMEIITTFKSLVFDKENTKS